jgi:hypothetical protein
MKYYVTILIVLSTLAPWTEKETKIELEGMKEAEEKPAIPQIPEAYKRFKERMAMLETGKLANPYTVVNRFGYMGKYQFGMKTLQGLVHKKYLLVPIKSLSSFLHDPDLQEQAMDALIRHNREYIIRNELNQYIGNNVEGILITEYGLLAGAHLLGPYRVKQFLLEGKVKEDGNGTKITEYIDEFSL